MSHTAARPSCWASCSASTTHARLMASLRPCCIGPAMPKQAWVIRKLWFEMNVRTMSPRLADARLGNVSSTTVCQTPLRTSKFASREFVPPMSPAKIMTQILLTHIPCPAWQWPRHFCSAPALGDHDCSTIDVIRLSSNVVSVSRGQKSSHSSNIFRLIPTPSREGSKTTLDFFFHRDPVPLSSCVQSPS